MSFDPSSTTPMLEKGEAGAASEELGVESVASAADDLTIPDYLRR